MQRIRVGYVIDDALTCLPGEQVLGLEGSDVRDSREDVCTVDYCSLNAVTLVDASVSSFFVQYKLQQHQPNHSNTAVAWGSSFSLYMKKGKGSGFI